MLTVRRISLLVALIALTAASVLVGLAPTAGASDPNPDCTLLVPANPMSASGLATPYQLTATNPADGPCHELESTQSAFVEAAVLDPATGAIGIYHPVVVDEATVPASPPVVPALPAGAVVGIWFGSNGDTLRLSGAGAAGAVNGWGRSVFGQFSYLNAPAFFAAARRAGVTPPPLGVARDGQPCPTVRDFVIVDQDQSDNVGTPYWDVGGSVQNRPATADPSAGRFANGSDEGLLAKFVDPALGCTPWKLPSLDGNAPGVSLAANELSAAAHQDGPVALVPLSDPMTLVHGHFSVRKTDLYRAGVDQPAWPAGQDPRRYCTDLQQIAPPRLAANRAALQSSPSPAPGVDLYDFLTARLAGSLTALGCHVDPVVPPQRPHRGHHHPGRDD